MTPRTFLASASCIVTAGATPVFADVDRDTQNITAETIRAMLSPKTRAVICVHLAGMPCDMDPIMALAVERGLSVIEDCAQAHGATYKGRPVGSIGDVGCFSFCQDKIMTTGGEGGMVTTSNRALWSRMWSYKDHGKSWDAVYEREHPPGFRWLHESFGTNWRMTEMQAAIGRIQLRRMPEWSAARRANAERIWACARELPGLRVPELALGPFTPDPSPLRGEGSGMPSPPTPLPQAGEGSSPVHAEQPVVGAGTLEGVAHQGEAVLESAPRPEGERGQGRGADSAVGQTLHAAYKCYVFVEPDRLAPGWDRDRIMAEINARGVPCFSGSCSEVYLEKAFDGCPSDGRTWRPAERLPVAKELGETSLMFLVHPTLTGEEIDRTCAVLAEVMAAAARP